MWKMKAGSWIQREFAGTASKSETEAMLRKAMEDYEAKKFVAKSENVTVGQLLDMWVEEELKPGVSATGNGICDIRERWDASSSFPLERES